MPRTRQELIDAIDAIDVLIARQVNFASTGFSDQQLTARPLAELYAERSRLVRQLNALDGRSSTRYAAFRKDV